MFELSLELREEERLSFLREQCGTDHALFQEVVSLLAVHDAAEVELNVSPIRSLDVNSVLPAVPADAVPGYEILREIHRGGQGIVYHARQLGTKRDVALKFMLTGPFASETTRRRFQREIEVVSQLTHPGIVPVFDSGTVHGQQFFAMEYVPGLPLDEYVRTQGLNVIQTLKLFTKVCDAVAYAHRNDVIHRDLKPSNILVSADGQPHVLDFGLAKPRTSAEVETIPLSMTGQVMGTLAYMSPEHAAGRPSDVDAASDVYSLAVILYELLAGQLPYDLNSTMVDNLICIRTAEPRPLKSAGAKIDSEVATIIFKALNKEKSRRYADAGALGDDINRHLTGELIEAKRDSRLYVLRKRVRRHIVPTGVVFALVAGVSIGVLLPGVDSPPTKISPALRPRMEGELYSQIELETQLDAMRDLHKQGLELPALTEELHVRFGPLEESDFEVSMTAERRADLQKMKELDRFFVTMPEQRAMQEFLADEELDAMPIEGAPQTSGLVNDLAKDLLRLAIEAGE